MEIEKRLYEKIWSRKKTGESKIDKGSRVDVALGLLERGKRLLDVGCGDGILGYFAREKYEEVYGVDISEEALEIARRRGVKTKRVNLNKGKLPFRDEFFDAVVCLDVIEHVFEPRSLIKEIHRVLQKKGVLIISTPNNKVLGSLSEVGSIRQVP